MIRPISIPYIADRFLGVTIPNESTMYACSYDGIHKISFLPLVAVEINSERREDYDYLESLGETLGLDGGQPILQDQNTKLDYTFRPKENSQIVKIIRSEKEEKIRFDTLSGDWFYATLSKCGKFILLADPYLIAVYEIIAN